MHVCGVRKTACMFAARDRVVYLVGLYGEAAFIVDALVGSAGLGDEAGHDAVEGDAVVVPLEAELDKVAYCFRAFSAPQLDQDVAERGVEHDDALGQGCGRAMVR